MTSIDASAPDVVLSEVVDSDLPVFFEQQLEPSANYMAAFTSQNPADRDAFKAHWASIRAKDSITLRTIVVDGQVAGYLAAFDRWERREVSYWLGMEYWGKGTATLALRLFLDVVKERPLSARAARDNAASIRVLEKCGFRVVEYERAFAEARGAEIEEAILELASPGTGVGSGGLV